MFSDKKSQLIYPYWQQNSLFKGLTVCMPLIRKETETVPNLITWLGRIDILGSPVWKTNRWGVCLQYDSDTRLDTNYEVNNIDLQNSTFAYWCSTESSGVGEERLMYEFTDSSNNIWIQRYNNGIRVIFEAADDRHEIAYVDSVHNDGDTHLICVSSTPARLALYLDGVLLESDAPGVDAHGTLDASPLRVGYSSSSWLGTMSSACIWTDRGLSDGEVMELYNLGPSLGLNRTGDIELIIGAAASGAQAFKAAWAVGSNQLL